MPIMLRVWPSLKTLVLQWCQDEIIVDVSQWCVFEELLYYYCALCKPLTKSIYKLQAQIVHYMLSLIEEIVLLSYTYVPLHLTDSH